MSTKLSTDLHITRSTTRIHRPPGGASSISFGNEATPVDTGKAAPSATAMDIDSVNEITVEVNDMSVCEDETVNSEVRIVVSGANGIDEVIKHLSESLKREGIVGAEITRVQCPNLLPYVVKRVAPGSSVIIAIALLSNESVGIHEIAGPLTSSLFQIGLETDVPIIPGVVNHESLLELRAYLKDHCASWAKSVSELLRVSQGEVTFEPQPDVVIKAPTVITNDTVSVDVLLDGFRESLKERGARGIIGLSRKFRIADDDGNGQLDFNEFLKVVNEHVMKWSLTQTRLVFDFFDTDKSGTISFNEFLIGVRGNINDRRKQFVLMAFDLMDSDKSGIIDIKDISAKYDASHHPDVKAGKRTADDVLLEFLDTFDTIDKDGKVTPEEFIKYYTNVSASIDDDDYFELMMRNAWHISGGEGWCENSTCKRVLVTHPDGHQTVEEIKDDLGVKHDPSVSSSWASTTPSNKKATAAAPVPAAAPAPVAAAPQTAPDTPNRPAAGGRPNNATSAMFGYDERPATAPSRRRAPGGQSSITFG